MFIAKYKAKKKLAWMKETVSKHYGNSEKGRMSDIWNALWALGILEVLRIVSSFLKKLQNESKFK